MLVTSVDGGFLDISNIDHGLVSQQLKVFNGLTVIHVSLYRPGIFTSK